MIKLTDKLWLGNSQSEIKAPIEAFGIDAILNVAIDLPPSRKGITYRQCGLMDGPGNQLETYHAAVLLLIGMLRDGRHVMVCCHEGGRALAVCMMYLHLTHRRGWSLWLNSLRELTDVDLKEPHEEHRKAFEKLKWDFLEGFMEGLK